MFQFLIGDNPIAFLRDYDYTYILISQMKNVALIRLALMIFYCHCSIGAIGQSISGIINSYYQVTAINTSTNAVVVSNAAGLAPGVKVLIIQMKGAAINSA